jgi:putative oxidoreductase
MDQTRRETSTSIGLLLIRLFLGFGLAAHGYTKFFGEHGIAGFAGFLKSLNVPRPETMAYVSAATELLGGILVGIGLLTRLVAAPLAFNMFVAAFTAHRASYFITNSPPGMEYALNLGVIFLALVFTGPGKYSLDRRLFHRKKVSMPPAGPTA